MYYQQSQSLDRKKNLRLVLIFLLFFTLVNLVWYFHYRSFQAQYSYRLDSIAMTIHKQKEIIEKQEFIIEKYQEKNLLEVTVTAYTPRKSETDSTPEFTAIMSRSRPGYTAAVSRDLIQYLGRKIYIEGVGVFGLEDVMNARYKKRIDLMFGSVNAARQFGKKKMKVVVLSQFDEAFRSAIDNGRS